jgi:Thioredoxin like C-terminal domain
MCRVSLGIGRSNAADGGAGAAPSRTTLPLCGPDPDGLDAEVFRHLLETYIGYERAENFVSPGGTVQDTRNVCMAGMPRLNEWSLAGDWTIGSEHAVLHGKGGSIIYRFHARDLHLVLGPAPGGEPVRFRVTLDGAVLGNSGGVDVDADGRGMVTGQRLYQLVRQSGTITDHTFKIEFLDPGVQAYAFTFG